MKKYIPLLLTAALHSNAFSTPYEKPNVIVVLTDDQGYGDFSCHGNPILKTPALDRLYGESVRFGNFHVAPLSTPSRGQLMTGLNALNNKASTVLTGRNLMRRDVLTMPEIFNENGYSTGIFGKWHLGDTYPDRPMDRGFQKCIWHKGWGLLSETEFDNDYYKTRYLDSLETKYSDSYCSDLWFDKAMDWMGEMVDRKQPFFTYLALNSPHGPFYSPEDDFKFYLPLVKESTTASFFGMIRNIDSNMARLDEWLDKYGIKDNTILVFMNDNGGTGGVDVFNAGMRDKKGSNYEGGHRAACFIRWSKGKFGKPRTVSYPSQIQDILPTFIDLLGFKTQENYLFDGESLSPVLRSEKISENRMFVVQYGGNIKPEKYYSCVVWNTWRLVGENELYNLDKDPGQKSNIANEHPDVLQKMRLFYETWWKKTELEINNFVPVIIGSPKENPVILTSDNWEEGAVNTQWNVALASGPPRGGVIHTYTDHGGTYKIELSRWPFHIHRNLTVTGPGKAVGGTKIRPGKALPIQFGCLSINNSDPIISESKPEAGSITFNIKLDTGYNTFQAWFQNKEGKDLCGAYFIRVEKLL